MRLALLALLALPALASWTWTNTGGPSGSGTLPTLAEHAAGTTTYTISCPGGTWSQSETQAILDDVWGGDVILVEPSTGGVPCVMDTAYTGGGIRIRKPRFGSGPPTLQTSAYALLPASGTLVIAAYRSLMPTIRSKNQAALFIGHRIVQGWIIRGIRVTQFPPPYPDGTVYPLGTILWPEGTVFPGGVDLPIGNATDPVTSVVGNGLIHISVNGGWNSGGTVRTGARSGWYVISTQSPSGQDRVYLSDTTSFQAGDELWIDKDGSRPEPCCAIVLAVFPTYLQLTANLQVTHNAGDYVELIPSKDDDLPKNINLHQIIVEPDPYYAARCGISLNAGPGTILHDSRLGPAVLPGNSSPDSQTICGYNGKDVLIDNNFIDTATENFMSGGAKPGYDTSINGFVFTRNQFAHSPPRDRTGPWSIVRSSPESPIVWRGKSVFPVGANGSTTALWYLARNTGIPCATEPNWAVASVQFDPVPDCGVTWELRGSGTKPYIKNQWEQKDGVGFQVINNGFSGYTNASAWNQSQAGVWGPKSISQPNNNTYCPPDSTGWPTCHRASIRNLVMRGNFARNFLTAFSVFGQQNFNGAENSDNTIEGNLMVMTEPPGDDSGTSVGFPAIALISSFLGANYQGPSARIKILHNTLIEPYAPVPNSAGIRTVAGPDGLWPESQLAGNIFARNTNALIAESTSTACGGTTKDKDGADCVIETKFPGTNYGSYLGKNIIVGSPTGPTNFKGLSFNACPTSAACSQETQWDYNHPTYGKMFRDYNGGDFTIRQGHWGRGAEKGRDIGADPEQVPQIRGLVVAPTDRAVLLQYRVTAAITQPCVVEINRSPDFRFPFSPDGNPAHDIQPDWGAELSDLATYHGREADNHNAYPRQGASRTIVLGTSVPLLADTDYYGRLTCSDQVLFRFRTLAALTGTVTLTRSQGAATAMTWGTSYSRDTGAISGGGAGSCAGNACTAVVPRGSIIFTDVGGQLAVLAAGQ